MARDDARPADQDRPPAADLHRSHRAPLPAARGPLTDLQVVGAALLRDARLLASRRTGPESLAGMWELPGGKVEAGESDEQALRRELVEELGCDVVVGARIGPELRIGERAVMRVYLAELVSGEPELRDHDEHRWLAADELDDVPWIPADRPVLDALRELLESTRR